jgi:pantoate--beta-alanine ligase
LSAEERELAQAIPQAIERVQRACASGITAADAARDVEEELAAVPGITVDYVTIRGADLGPAPAAGIGRVLIAARVGSTRLLDNAEVVLGGAA